MNPLHKPIELTLHLTMEEAMQVARRLAGHPDADDPAPERLIDFLDDAALACDQGRTPYVGIVDSLIYAAGGDEEFFEGRKGYG